jgi:hypothetical protein
MKTLGVILLFIISVAGLVQVLSQHDEDFIRIAPATVRPTPLPTTEEAPKVTETDQRSALDQVDPGALDRAIAVQAFAGHR